MDPNPLHAFPMHAVIVSSVVKFLNYWNYKAWSSTRRKKCLCLFRYDLSQAPSSLVEMTYFVEIKVFRQDLFLLYPNASPNTRCVIVLRCLLSWREKCLWLSVLRPVSPPMPLICQSLPPYSAIETTNMCQYLKLFPFMKSPGTFIAIIFYLLQ